MLGSCAPPPAPNAFPMVGLILENLFDLSFTDSNYDFSAVSPLGFLASTFKFQLKLKLNLISKRVTFHSCQLFKLQLKRIKTSLEIIIYLRPLKNVKNKTFLKNGSENKNLNKLCNLFGIVLNQLTNVNIQHCITKNFLSRYLYFIRLL